MTFDCAGTLLSVDWVPGRFAVECANEAGLELGEPEEVAYARLLGQRWRDYEILNMQRDAEVGDAFWRQLTVDWLSAIDHSVSLAPQIIEISRTRLLDKFAIYDDVIPALDALDALGVRSAIVSNWDYSLHRILKAKGLTERFEVVIASLEEGVEKPEPRIFEIAMEQLGVTPDQVAHIGDDPLDDFTGARNAGLRGLLIDRTLEVGVPPRLARLTELPEVLGWTS